MANRKRKVAMLVAFQSGIAAQHTTTGKVIHQRECVYLRGTANEMHDTLYRVEIEPNRWRFVFASQVIDLQMAA